MSRNLLPDLAPSGLDHYELLLTLKQHFKSACFDDHNQLIYPCASDYALKVRWKDGRATHIHPGPRFSSTDFENLNIRIQTDLVECPGMAIGSEILFSSPHPLHGHFRTDQLQLLPAPPDAPTPDETHADHPFVLEFAFPRSINNAITRKRRVRLSLEWAWILNALLRTTIKCQEPRVKRLWVYCKHEQNPMHSHFTNGSYIYSGSSGLADEFTHPTTPPITQIGRDEYYDTEYLRGGDVLILPDSLPQMLSIVDRLTPADRRWFLRAARWVSVARELWDYHVSSYYIALVAGIESLMNAESPPRCDKCKQVTGITRRFRAFVERYSTGSGRDKTVNARLYAIRSELAHGEYLFDIDESP